jgi:hypothetical protein
MKLLTNKMNKGLTTVALLSLALVACGGGSVSGFGATSGKSSSTTVVQLVPTATPFGATYGSPQSVTITGKAGSTFYYTTNGTTPTTSSTLYTAPISITANTTLKVLAKGADGALSAVITEVYTIDTTAPTITASHANGSYAAAQYVTLSSNETNTTIYYTTDGSTPTTSSKIYTNPVVVGANINPFTLKFFGKDIAGNSSGETTRTYTTGSTLTDLQVVDTSSSAQTNVPITFGQVFKVGELTTGTSVAGTGTVNGSIPLQVNVKATHGDGSVRHAIISAVLPNLGSGQTETISFTNAAMGSVTAVTPATFLAANPTFSARIDVTIGGVAYSADAVTLLGGTYTQWLSGPIVNEWIVTGPLRKVSDSTAHPHLEARFAIRSFAGSSKTKVDVTVENNKTFTAGSQNFTYDSKIYVGGAEVDSITSLVHYHHARWHKSFWWGTAPQVHLKHNIDYLIATKAVPNYDRSVVPSSTAIANMVTNMVGKTGPMKVGLALNYMPNTGGRIDIGPLPGWYALYLLSMDKDAKNVMLGIADGSGSWSMHYRDETDANNMPVRVDKTGTSANGANYRDLSTHDNAASVGPLPVPRCAAGSTTLCVTPFVHDASHQPGLAYLPYLVTGDYFYLEELQFWVAWNPLGTNPSYRGYEKGLINWDQVRAQAWSMRTLGQAAYITPDSHPIKTLYNTMVAENLSYYNTMYTIGNQNQLGILNSFIAYDTIKGSQTGYATWMDDFFTWSIGYLDELGFTDAHQLLVWKSKFSVGRMTGPSYCWIMGAEYALAVRPTSSSPIYTTLADAYQATYSAVGKDGTKLTDKACGSQAMTDWIKTNTGYIYLSAGEMAGYSTTDTGFPSNMQIGLSAAATSGISNARSAWVTFMNRTNKPDYSSGPQFAVLPRN